MSLIALTGCTGFIGRRLLMHLESAPGQKIAVEKTAGPKTAVEKTASEKSAGEPHSLRVHSRRPLGESVTTSAPNLSARMQRIGGDLSDVSTWRTLLANADLVVHCAGAVRGRNAEEFAVNHRSVAALVQALDGLSRPPPLLLVSSLAARQPQLSDYAQSKQLAELHLQARTDLRSCILRPPAVYGPGDVELLPLLRTMARGIGVYPGDLDARLSLLHVDDLCRLICAWLQTPVVGVTLEPDDGKPGGYRWRDLHAGVAEVSGRRVHALRLAPVLLRTAASLLSVAAALRGHSHSQAPMLSRGKVRELTAQAWVASPMPRSVGDWQPRIDLPTGLRQLLQQPDNQAILP